MNKIFKIILITSITIFSAGLLFIPSTQAIELPPLFVEFEYKPLFNEADFKPGDSVTRWVEVFNNSGETKPIATEAINYPGFPNPGNVPNDDLSRALSIIIREKGGSDLYGGSTGEKTLFNFYQNGETYLSDIENGSNKVYEFEIGFPSEKENEWQEKTTTFDILIGFQGGGGMGVCGNGVKEGVEQCDGTDLGLGGQTCTGLGYSGGTLSCNLSCNFDTSNCTGTGGGGGGGGLPPGLTILGESVEATNTGETSVTIIWTTSYFSTSQVIYGAQGEAHTLNLSDNTGTPPKYGYAHTTAEHDTSPKVISHSVTIYGLSSGTTYYCRAVSHASLAISREFTFTTLGVKEIGEIGEGILPPEEEITPGGEEAFVMPEEEIKKPSEEITEGEEGIVGPEEAEKPILAEERPLGEIFATEGLLAAIGALPFNLKVILIIAGVIIAGLLILWLIRKRRFKKIKS